MIELSSCTLLVTHSEKSLRLGFHSDPSIPSIGITPLETASCLKRIKSTLGALKLAYLPTHDGRAGRYFVSLKSFTKHTGLGLSVCQRLLTTSNALENISRLASLVIENAPRDKVRVFFRQALQSYQDLVLSRDLSVSARKIHIATTGDKTHLLCLDRILGTGFDSEVWSVSDAFSESSPNLAFKISKRIRLPEGLKSIYYTLQELNPKGSAVGLQPPYHRIIELTHKEEPTQVGFLMAKYTGSMKGFRFTDAPQLRNAFGQLTSGVRTLHQKKFCHRDIKPSNLLFNEKRFDIADLDDCERLSEIEKIFLHHKRQAHPSCFDTTEKLWSISTDLYCCQKDEDALAIIVQQFDDRTLSYSQASKQVLNLLQARDLYALSLSFLELLCEDSSIESDTVAPAYLKLTTLGLSSKEAKQITQSLKDMLSPIHATRFDAFNRLYLLFNPLTTL